MTSFNASAERYDVDIQTPTDEASETSHTRTVRLVGSGKRVLDVGCATGSLAEVLVGNGCTVVGVERDPGAAKRAAAHCAHVEVMDLDGGDLQALAGHGPFDVIVAADVLEHLLDPARTLRQLAGLLAPQGYLVTSIPNVAHGSVRLALLAGRFPYSDVGLLDHTHLRFYTLSSMTDMITDGGFDLVYVERQRLAPQDGEVLAGVALEQIPAEVRHTVDSDEDAWVYQYVGISIPSGAGGGLAAALRGSWAELQALRGELREHRSGHAANASALAARTAEAVEQARAARDQLVRVTDANAMQARRITTLEQMLAEAADREGAALADLKAAADARAEAEALRAEVAAIHRSRLWRAGAMYRGTVGRLRGRR